jgi:ubiquinone/menaquinone biosynthesis C-methylase UbiE
MTTEQVFQHYQNQFGRIAIDLGCGPNKKHGCIGIDVLPLQNVDIVANIENGLPEIPSDTVDIYETSHFLEHIQNFEGLIREIHRTLKKEGQLRVVVPHFSNPYFYSDYTHKRFFGLYSFDYFSDNTNTLKHIVPVYNHEIKFSIIRRKLIFKSGTFPLINLLRKHILTRVFNFNNYMQALYEEVFSAVFRCAEIEFILTVSK